MELVEAAVELVGPGFADQVNDAAPGAAELGAGVADNQAKLFGGVDREGVWRLPEVKFSAAMPSTM